MVTYREPANICFSEQVSKAVQSYMYDSRTFTGLLLCTFTLSVCFSLLLSLPFKCSLHLPSCAVFLCWVSVTWKGRNVHQKYVNSFQIVQWDGSGASGLGGALWLTSTGESGSGHPCVTEDTHRHTHTLTEAPARRCLCGKEGKGQLQLWWGSLQGKAEALWP